MAKGFSWKKECAEYIEEWAPKELQIIHLAIFGKSVSSNLVRRKIREFTGLEFHNEDEQQQHIDMISKNLSEIELQIVCNFLGIENDEASIKADLVNKI